jgi:ABC-type uncharacterized transport system substrate-binding protein
MLEPVIQRSARVRKLSKYMGALALVSGLFLAGGQAGAHPHVWIDLETKPVIDADGNITGLEVAWIFDPFYTVFALEDQRTNDGVDQEGLNRMVATNLQKLRPYDFFTDIRAGGAKVELGPVETFNAGVLDDKLWMHFIVTFETPVDPRAESFSYAVYDPTFYIEIAYADRAKANLDAASMPGCEAELDEANPTAETITLAQSLDAATTGPDTLGAMFAQRVRIECN